MSEVRTPTRDDAPQPVSAPEGGIRRHRRILPLAALAGLAAAGVGIGLGVSLGGSSGTAAPVDPMFAYYRSIVGQVPGSMMGGRSMMGGGTTGSSGYGWMMGGARAPGWMMGGNLPSRMMGSASDPGKVMGRLWAEAPGPRISASAATRLGTETPAGATIDRTANSVLFRGGDVHLAMVASPPGAPDETFRIAGLTNPTVAVPLGAKVTIEMVNADPDTAHGVVVTAGDPAASWMPMMTAAPAFPGSALWFLGNPTSAGMHTGTVAFTASRVGTFHYLCPVPGHAQKGMVGSFTVQAGG